MADILKARAGKNNKVLEDLQAAKARAEQIALNKQQAQQSADKKQKVASDLSASVAKTEQAAQKAPQITGTQMVNMLDQTRQRVLAQRAAELTAQQVGSALKDRIEQRRSTPNVLGMRSGQVYQKPQLASANTTAARNEQLALKSPQHFAARTAPDMLSTRSGQAYQAPVHTPDRRERAAAYMASLTPEDIELNHMITDLNGLRVKVDSIDPNTNPMEYTHWATQYNDLLDKIKHFSRTKADEKQQALEDVQNAPVTGGMSISGQIGARYLHNQDVAQAKADAATWEKAGREEKLAFDKGIADPRSAEYDTSNSMQMFSPEALDWKAANSGIDKNYLPWISYSEIRTLNSLSGADQDTYRRMLIEAATYREAGYLLDTVDKNDPVEVAALAVSGGLGNAVGGLVQSWNSKVKGDYTPVLSSANSLATGALSEQLHGVMKGVADVGQALGFMLPTIAVSMVTRNIGGLFAVRGAAGAARLVRGGNAAVDAMKGVQMTSKLGAFGEMYESSSGMSFQQALEQGYKIKDAKAYATINGLLEAGLQSVLGGYRFMGANAWDAAGKALGKIKLGADVTKKLAQVSTAMAAHPATRYLFQTLEAVGAFTTRAGEEFVEEWMQAWLDPAVRNVIFDENNEVKPFSAEALYNGLIGGLTAGLFNIAGVTSDWQGTRMGRIIDVGRRIAVDENAKVYALEYGMDAEEGSVPNALANDIYDKLLAGTATDADWGALNMVNEAYSEAHKPKEMTVSEQMEKNAWIRQNLLRMGLNAPAETEAYIRAQQIVEKNRNSEKITDAEWQGLGYAAQMLMRSGIGASRQRTVEAGVYSDAFGEEGSKLYGQLKPDYGNKSVEMNNYDIAFNILYASGARGVDFNTALKSLDGLAKVTTSIPIDRIDAEKIWNAGKADGVQEGAGYAEQAVNAQPGLADMDMPPDAVSANEQRELDYLGKKAGVRVIITDAQGKVNGAQILRSDKSSIENGRYDPKTATVYLHMLSKDKPWQVVKHEFVHRLKNMAPEEFEKYMDFCVSHILASGKATNYGRDMLSLFNLYTEGGEVSRSQEYLLEEFMGDFTRDELFPSMGLIRELCQKQTKTGRRIKDVVRGLIRKFKGEGYGLTNKELRQAEQMFADALDEVERRVKMTENKVETNIEEATVKTEEAEELEQAASLSETRSSITAQDEQYLDAVKRGDMKTAQRMVDAAAKAAGYTQKGYHGTIEKFTVFDPKKSSRNNDMGAGIYVTNSEADAKGYAGLDGLNPDLKQDLDVYATDIADEAYDMETEYNDWVDAYNDAWDARMKEIESNGHVVRLFTRMTKPFTISEDEYISMDMVEQIVRSLPKEDAIYYDDYIYDFRRQADSDGRISTAALGGLNRLSSALKALGYDGIIDKTVASRFDLKEGTEHQVLFYATSAKSAEPVTYDDKGNVIPLSERFNTENEDIRYSVTPVSAANEQTAVERMETKLDELTRKLDQVTNTLDANQRLAEAKEVVLPEVDVSKMPVSHGVPYAPEVVKIMESDDYVTPEDRYSTTTLDPWAVSRIETFGDTLEIKRQNAIMKAVTNNMVLDDVINGFIPGGTYDYNEEGPLRENEDIYLITFDMDTSCPRAIQFREYIAAVEKKAGRMLTEAECINLLELMRAYGQMVPCTYCYVETKRMALSGEYNNWFIFHHNVVNAASDEEAKTKMYGRDKRTGKLSGAAGEVLKEWLTDKGYDPTIEEIYADYHTARNSVFNLLDQWREAGKLPDAQTKRIAAVCDFFDIDNNKKASQLDKDAAKEIAIFVDEWLYDLQSGNGHKYKGVNDPTHLQVDKKSLATHHRAMGYAKSSSSAHDVNNYAPYTDQLKKYLNKRDYLNAIGGVRKHSSNDFRIDYVQDYLLFYADLAAGGFMGHTYSKSIEFAQIFGWCGDRINMSIAMYGDDVNDITENWQEGAPWEDVKKLRAASPNIGTMAMVVNDAQLSYALNADWIDMIIPFHASGLKKAVWYNMHSWLNYTGVQEERPLTQDDIKERLESEGFDLKGLRYKTWSDLYRQYHPEGDLPSLTKIKKILADEKVQTKGLESEAIREAYYKEHPVKEAYNKDKKGNLTRWKPHFLPGDLTLYDAQGNAITVEGHHNDKATYLRLCEEYGVHPRFDGTVVTDANGNEINVVDHPNYMKLVKETARTDTPQQPIEFNFNQREITIDGKTIDVTKYLGGMTPLQYMMDQLHKKAEDGGYENLKEDPYNVVDEFIQQYLGKNRPLGYLTERAANTIALRFKDQYGEDRVDEEIRKQFPVLSRLSDEVDIHDDEFGVTPVPEWEQTMNRYAEMTPEQVEEYTGVKADLKRKDNQRFSITSAQAKRDAGEKLTESAFYSLYSAHKLNLRNLDNIEEQIASIREEGFQGNGSFGVNLMPTRQHVEYRGVGNYNLLLGLEQAGKIPEGTAERFRTNLGEDYGVPVPENATVANYGPRKGEYILFVPESGVDTHDNYYRVNPGWRPDFDWEIVKADYDYQPYYEMYSKAYDAAHEARKSISAADDIEYLRLAADPETNREALQKMVDEAAEAAGYDSPMLYHGTSSPFTVYDRSKLGNATGAASAAVGFYLTNDRSIAENFSKISKDPVQRAFGVSDESATVMGQRVRFVNPLVYEADSDEDSFNLFSDELFEFAKSYTAGWEYPIKTVSRLREMPPAIKREIGRTFAKQLQNRGYDGVIIRDTIMDGKPKHDFYVAFNSSQIKSADPVTYDDNGNVIPLSERFNTEEDDIRYSIGYHAGDLGKAESLFNQSGGRHTGHFGTGTYFVGDRARLDGYNSRNGQPAPIETVDFDKYNLFRPDNYKDGMALHEFLKGVNTYYDRANYLVRSKEEYEAQYDAFETAVVNMYEAGEDLADIDVEGVLNYDRIIGIAETLLGRYRVSEIVMKRVASDQGPRLGLTSDGYLVYWEDDNDTPVSGLELAEMVTDPDRLVYELEQEIESHNFHSARDRVADYEAFTDSFADIADILGISEEQVSETLAQVGREISEAGYNYEQMQTEDSASTRFMKALGYEGVDVRDIEELDNTMYGSVIYDLKGEDLARKQEIGTARYSLSVDERAKEAGLFRRNAGEELDVHIPDGIDTATGEPVDFISLILDGIKKGETRSVGSGLPVGKWVGLAKNGVVYGRVKFGEHITITKDSPEYGDAMIAGTDYDIPDGESKWYYPVVEVMDLRDDPRTEVRRGPKYGSYQFKSDEPITYDDEGNPIPIEQRMDTENPDRRYSLSQIPEELENIAEGPRSPEEMISLAMPKEKQGAKAGIAKNWHTFQRLIVDAGETVHRISEALDDPSLYTYYNNVHAAQRRAEKMMELYAADVKGQRTGKSLNAIFDPIRAKGEDYYRDFQLYLYHQHNMDLMSREDPEKAAAAKDNYNAFLDSYPAFQRMTQQEIDDIAWDNEHPLQTLAKEYNALASRWNYYKNLHNKPVFGVEVTAEESAKEVSRLQGEHEEFRDLAEEVYGYVKNLQKYRVSCGLISQMSVDHLNELYPHYVPTYLLDEQGVTTGPQDAVTISSTIKEKSGNFKEVKLMPLHVALANQTRTVTRNGAMNLFGQRLLGAYQQLKTEMRNMPLPKELEKKRQGRDKVRGDIVRVSELYNSFNPEREETVNEIPDAINVTGAAKSNSFTVRVGDAAYEMVVSPELFAAIKALAPAENANERAVLSWLAKANNIFKALCTGYNPIFTAKNFIRDLQDVLFYSRDLSAFARNYPRAWHEIAKGGKYWETYQSLGGLWSSFYDYETGELNRGNKLRKWTLGRIETLNEWVEQAPRLAEFMSAVDKVGGIEKATMDQLMDAMYAAADVTVNFGRKGTATWVNTYAIPFFNPAVQGFSKFVRRFTETKGAKGWANLICKAALFGIMPSLLNQLLYADDDDWDELSDSDKNLCYCFKIGKDLWIKIPKGRALSLFGLGVNAGATAASGEDVDWWEYVKTGVEQVGPTNPATSNIFYNLTSSKIFDKDNPGTTWYGSDIESQRMQNYAPEERYDAKTDSISKWLGKALGLSPKKINYIIDQYSGIIGDVVLPLLTPAAERNALAKAFTIDSNRQNKLSSEFYDLKDELTYNNSKTGADETDALMVRWINKQAEGVNEVNAEIRRIEEDTSMSGKEKSDALDIQYGIRNELIRQALDTSGQWQNSMEAAWQRAQTEITEDDIDTEDLTAEDIKDKLNNMRQEYAFREATRDVYGAEVALEMWDKSIYNKATEIKDVVSYDDFYEVYADYSLRKYHDEGSPYMAIVDYGMSDAEATAMLSQMMKEDDFHKVTVGNAGGMSTTSYIRYLDIRWNYNYDGNTNLKQSETEDAIRSLMRGGGGLRKAGAGSKTVSSGISETDAAIIWQLQNTGWKWYNNPFSQGISHKIYDALHADNTATSFGNGLVNMMGGGTRPANTSAQKMGGQNPNGLIKLGQ